MTRCYYYYPYRNHLSHHPRFCCHAIHYSAIMAMFNVVDDIHEAIIGQLSDIYIYYILSYGCFCIGLCICPYQSVSALAWRLGPVRTALADTKSDTKNTHMIIILSLMYCDLYWPPQNIWNKVNLFIKYHIQGIVRVYQWVRNAILL